MMAEGRVILYKRWGLKSKIGEGELVKNVILGMYVSSDALSRREVI